MRVLGLLLTLIGIFWAISAFKMDTTVTSEASVYGSGETAVYVPSVTVNNLGKMDDRRNQLMFSGLTVLIGVVFLGFASIPRKTVATGLRACPFCAELIQPAALKCRYCNSEVSAIAGPNSRKPIPAKVRSGCRLAVIIVLTVTLGGYLLLLL